MLGHGSHFFVDESKNRDYVLAVAAIDRSALDSVRSALRTHLIRGQRSMHFKNEREGRRRAFLNHARQLGWSSVVIVSTDHDHRRARTACLAELMALASSTPAERLVIELDESHVISDRRTLLRARAALGIEPSIRFDHLPRSADPGLWVADAVAWSFARGGVWRARLDGLLTAIIRL